jgi:hypothetical protein
MTETTAGRAHLIAGGFPPGSSAGHDHDYARLRLLDLLAEQDIPASVANDFADVEKWLPGTSGGRAERVEGLRQRRTVKTEHHGLLGSYFLTHPPICKIRVDVDPTASPLTRGLGSSFDVEDEPYFIEIQDPGSTRILLTADYGANGLSPAIGTLYTSDTSLQPDGRTRVLGYTRQIGNGAVTYFALGHCHNPAIRAARPADPTDTTPLTFRGSWETDAFITLLRNAIAWGVAA